MNREIKKSNYESPAISEMVVILEQAIAGSPGDVNVGDYGDGGDIPGDYEIDWNNN